MASTISASLATGNLTGSAKLNDVTKLLQSLQDDLELQNLQPQERDAALEKLKVYGRDPQNADPIFTKRGINTLTRHAFDGTSVNASRNALRCLANAMLLKPATRQMFVDTGYESKVCALIKEDSRDEEFLVSRILFLTTYGTNINITELIDQHQLAAAINQNLARHAKLYETQTEKADSNPMEDMALVETLKLLFNIANFCPQRNESFVPGMEYILMILRKRQIIPGRPMEPPMAQLVNSLLNIPFGKGPESTDMLFPKPDQKINVERVIELLESSLRSYREDEIEVQISPLITLMRQVYEAAPSSVQTVMRGLLLPNDSERNQPLGRSQSLSSRLLRLSTSAMAPTAREEVSQLLFEMSDKDARTFVRNVGYGYASGFLAQHNVPVPENALEAWSISGDENAKSPSSSETKPVNPFTGQTLESEPKFDGPEMTQQEKEKEAERLMVLFERMRTNGVITVEHPLAKMQQEGRFEELHSDDDSE